MMNEEMFDEQKVIEQSIPKGGVRADEDFVFDDLGFEDEEEPSPFDHKPTVDFDVGFNHSKTTDFDRQPQRRAIADLPRIDAHA